MRCGSFLAGAVRVALGHGISLRGDRPALRTNERGRGSFRGLSKRGARKPGIALRTDIPPPLHTGTPRTAKPRDWTAETASDLYHQTPAHQHTSTAPQKEPATARLGTPHPPDPPKAGVSRGAPPPSTAGTDYARVSLSVGAGVRAFEGDDRTNRSQPRRMKHPTNPDAPRARTGPGGCWHGARKHKAPTRARWVGTLGHSARPAGLVASPASWAAPPGGALWPTKPDTGPPPSTCRTGRPGAAPVSEQTDRWVVELHQPPQQSAPTPPTNRTNPPNIGPASHCLPTRFYAISYKR